jgi:hypothetical protein
MKKNVSTLISLTCLYCLSAAGFYLTLNSDFDLDPTVSGFTDTFQNGAPSASDYEINIWTVTLPQASAANENGGRLTLTATKTNTTSLATIANLVTPVQSRFNFFDQQIRVRADVEMTGINTDPWQTRSRLILASATGNGYSAPDTVMFSGREQPSVALSYKIDGPNLDPDSSSTKVTIIGHDPADTALSLKYGLVTSLDLTVNATRIQAVVGGLARLSQRTRITGLHHIDRSQWGSNGDSAVMLETALMGGSPADSSAIGTWDNLKVDVDNTPLLAEPFIDFEASYLRSTSSSNLTTGQYRMWLPSTEPVIRGVVFMAPGSGGDAREYVHDLAAQEGARLLGFALIGYQNAGNMNLWSRNAELIHTGIQAVLDKAATVSGHPELSNAPLCITGLSAGGFDSSYLATFWPERTIAFVAHRGGAYAPPFSEDTKKIPGMFIAGSKDGNSLTSPYALKSIFRSWRSQTAHVGFAIDWGVGHTIEGNQGWEFTWSWFVETASLRYPRPMVPSTDPSDGFPALLDLNDASAWLGDTATFLNTTPPTPAETSSFTVIAPISNYVGTLTNASWLPTEALARAYRALNSTDLIPRTLAPLQGAVRITEPAQFADPVFAGLPCTLVVDPREFGRTNTITQVQFYNGSTLLATDTNAPWSQVFTPAVPGFYTFSAVATAASGDQRDAFRILQVIPEHFSPIAFNQSVTLTSGQVSNGNVTGIDPEGRPLTFALQQNPSHGQLTVFNMNTGAYTYEPSGGFSGNDAFSFVPVSGGITGTAATVTFTVVAP